jgi:Ca2+-binding EF-hand superfamily protein
VGFVQTRWVSFRPVEPDIVEKIRAVFDEFDVRFTGYVRLVPVWETLRRSKRLREFIPRLLRLAKEDEGTRLTLPQLLTRLFARHHRSQMADLLSWPVSRPSKALDDQSQKELSTLFDAFDGDGDGALSLEEVSASVRQAFPKGDVRAVDLLRPFVDVDAVLRQACELIEPADLPALQAAAAAASSGAGAAADLKLAADSAPSADSKSAAAVMMAGGGSTGTARPVSKTLQMDLDALMQHPRKFTLRDFKKFYRYLSARHATRLAATS